ncbi:MAG: glycosyltransferase family 4 protein [Candidatus Eisenbacteria bacterium]|nr:glycosyltransferase family 4 protein [Candidatus Eisenbacteria bacterium]
MTVAFSRPTTLLSNGTLPEGYRLVADEALVSAQSGQRYAGFISESMARLNVARRLLSLRPAPAAVVAGRYGEAYSLVRGLLGRRWPPLVLLDVEWHARSRHTLRQAFSRAHHRRIAAGACAIQVFCEAEIERYASFFGIAREKFVWVPFCMDLDRSAFEVRDGDYIFTGGILDRDYPTLFEAVRDLPIEVRLAAPPQAVDARRMPPNVRLLGTVPRLEYFRQIAGARVVALSLTPDDSLRFPGVITYCAAMHLGKCVVLNEPVGSRSYIQSGVHGLAVPIRDPGALRAALQSVLDDGVLRARLAGAALQRARSSFTVRNYFEHLDRVLRSLRDSVPA